MGWAWIVKEKEVDDIRIVVSALIANGDSLLLIKRGETPKRGYYSFPEGHLKVGEDPIIGIVRECREEIGCAVEPLNDKVLVIEGPSNAMLPDDYLEKNWPPFNGKIGLHKYEVVNISSLDLSEPQKPNKKYLYVPCKLLGEPKRTQAALEIVFMTPREALELKFKRILKLMPTTSIVLALIELSEFSVS
ncbi:MAG: NUDIX domain-containing protein [Candidatus Nezhaarchaeota archaeon]|nr:NUDIX domain-containing protein [Candidatus Nezhaarchaeota archaeon]MCX8142348.1 NUDIX domain-containing protein [Candidatus Nezhaarchaeota archaeon]MDW8050679.1 NUDIX domain-containing protein [Nitrososphaerota archaeon]